MAAPLTSGSGRGDALHGLIAQAEAEGFKWYSNEWLDWLQELKTALCQGPDSPALATPELLGNEGIRNLQMLLSHAYENNRDAYDQRDAALDALKQIQSETEHNADGYSQNIYRIASAAIAKVWSIPAPASSPALADAPQLELEQVQLLAWAVMNSHTLARRALARSTSAYDREKWEHVLRICEKAGARSHGVLRASLPTELTEGSADAPAPQQEKPKEDFARGDSQ